MVVESVAVFGRCLLAVSGQFVMAVHNRLPLGIA
jgi:hypothetical protein